MWQVSFVPDDIKTMSCPGWSHCWFHKKKTRRAATIGDAADASCNNHCDSLTKLVVICAVDMVESGISFVSITNLLTEYLQSTHSVITHFDDSPWFLEKHGLTECIPINRSIWLFSFSVSYIRL